MKNGYKQCQLSKKIENGIERQISWIPEKFAKTGSYLELKSGDKWENGWLVESASEPAVEENIITRNSRDYLKTRIASDI